MNARIETLISSGTMRLHLGRTALGAASKTHTEDTHEQDQQAARDAHEHAHAHAQAHVAPVVH